VLILSILVNQNQLTMSQNWITTIALMAFILLAFVTAIPLFERFKEYSLFKKIYITTAVSLLFIIGCLDVYIRASDPSETDKLSSGIKRIENILNGKNKEVKTQKDTSKQKLIAVEKLNKKTFPSFAKIRFDASNGFTPAVNKTQKQDSLSISYRLVNYGTGQAANIKIYTMIANISNGKITILPHKTRASYNKSLIIFPGQNNGQYGVTTMSLNNSQLDSVYFCFKMDFSDSSKRSKSFSKILQVDKVGLHLNELEDTLYNNIENFLIKNKYWKPPFRQ
jgi:hypothetical protein